MSAVLFNIYWRQGKYEETLDLLAKYFEGSENNVIYKTYIAQIYACMGKKDSAEQILEELLSAKKQDDNLSVWIALIYFELGDLDKTFEWLDRACEEKDIWVLYLKSAWWWEPIRTDPRYIALLKKLDLTVD